MCSFDYNVSVVHVCIKQIFRTAEKASPSSAPSQCCAGVGVVMALFGQKPWFWLLHLSRDDLGLFCVADPSRLAQIFSDYSLYIKKKTKQTF
jgi:hypothetical protein